MGHKFRFWTRMNRQQFGTGADPETFAKVLVGGRNISFGLVWFFIQCRDGQFTLPHFFPGQDKG